jgi:hypothetical protein
MRRPVHLFFSLYIQNSKRCFTLHDLILISNFVHIQILDSVSQSVSQCILGSRLSCIFTEQRRQILDLKITFRTA